MMVHRRVTLVFLLTLTLVALYFCFIIFRPFISPIVTAVVTAIVFFPIHNQIRRVVKGPNTAALLSTVLVMLVIIIPMMLIAAAIIGEVKDLVALLQEESTQSGGWAAYFDQLLDKATQWIRGQINMPQLNLRELIRSRLGELAAFLTQEVGLVLGGIFSYAMNTAITLFTLFFLFREGKSMRRRLAALMPLTNEQVDKLFTGIENTIIGTVYGGLVVAAVQGTLVGLALWFFGIPSPVLWGVVAAFFALIPLVGTAAVWVPASLYLIASGHWAQGLVLIGWGAGVVGTIDNILRPYLMSGRVEMHTLLIFFAVFGGVSAFGFLGLFVGPVILAITATLLGMLRDEARQWQQLWREQPEEALADAPDKSSPTDGAG
ncbi:MAG TPA: AI-2E family transporter [Blastocatellia bacterium]|nr:AI-2E family transporter [Blastocatellia bacterium]